MAAKRTPAPSTAGAPVPAVGRSAATAASPGVTARPARKVTAAAPGETGAPKSSAPKSSAPKSGAPKSSPPSKSAMAPKSATSKSERTKAAPEKTAQPAPSKAAPAKSGLTKAATTDAPVTTASAPPPPPAKKSAPHKAPAAATSNATTVLRVGTTEKPWTAKELREVRAELEAERSRALADLEIAESDLQGLMRDAGEGAGDDQADAGASIFGREYEMSLAANSREKLEQVEHALERLDNGTYGICESCGNPIGKMRLQAAPRATLCLPCKTRQEHR
jgi:RNA polymerase-binding protein DksA